MALHEYVNPVNRRFASKRIVGVALVTSGVVTLAVLLASGVGPWSGSAGADQPVKDGAAVGAKLQTQQVGTPGIADFSPSEVLTRVTKIANAQLAATLGQPHGNGAVDVPAMQIDGHAVTVADLALKQLEFVPDTTRVTSVAGTSSVLPRATDVWVAVWQRSGVPAPDWGGIPTTISVEVELEDGTGKVLSMDVSRSKHD